MIDTLAVPLKDRLMLGAAFAPHMITDAVYHVWGSDRLLTASEYVRRPDLISWPRQSGKTQALHELPNVVSVPGV